MTIKLHTITAALLERGCTTTVSNTEAGILLAHAPTCPDYRQALDALAEHKARQDPRDRSDRELCSIQLRMSARYRTVEPTWCIRGAGYWYLRNTSNLGESHPAGYGQYPTLAECVAAGVAWAKAAPEYREVVVKSCALRNATQNGEAFTWEEAPLPSYGEVKLDHKRRFRWTMENEGKERPEIYGWLEDDYSLVSGSSGWFRTTDSRKAVREAVARFGRAPSAERQAELDARE